MYIYESKNDTVQLNSALNNTYTHHRLVQRHVRLHAQ